MHIIGRGRYAREVYPDGLASAGAATAALRNRNVAVVPQVITPFTPATSPFLSLVAAILYTPKVSGVIQVTSLLDLINGGAPETYESAVQIATGTGLSVSGGEGSSNGWFFGSTPSPTVGGAGIVQSQFLGIAAVALAATTLGNLPIAAAISQPLQIGVPVVIEVFLSELGGGNALAQVLFSSLSVVELP